MKGGDKRAFAVLPQVLDQPLISGFLFCPPPSRSRCCACSKIGKTSCRPVIAACRSASPIVGTRALQVLLKHHDCCRIMMVLLFMSV